MYLYLVDLTIWHTHSSLLCLQVKDTVEVDKNVSRHLSYELSKNDWNLLVSLFGVLLPFFFFFFWAFKLYMPITFFCTEISKCSTIPKFKFR